MKHVLAVISGPAGVGKGTIVKELLNRDNEGKYKLSVSCTTRLPRVGEQHGVSYFFITQEEFDKIASEGGFLEYDRHFGGCYGTPKAFVTESLKNHDVILEIDVHGALAIKQAYPDAVLMLVAPPSMEELEARLRGRGTETEEKIKDRLKRVEYELSHQDVFDYLVVNDVVDRAVQTVESILENERTK